MVQYDINDILLYTSALELEFDWYLLGWLLALIELYWSYDYY